jgi:lipoprotein-releasing system permease protein
MKTEILIALRYTFTKHKEKFVSIINNFAIAGITLGVATLIIVMSVMNGYEKELLGKILGFKGHLTITTRDLQLKQYSEIEKIIQQNISGIISTQPVIEMQALAMSENNTTGVIVKGMQYDKMLEKINLSSGAIIGDNECHGLFIGNLLDINLKHDGKIKLIIPKFNETMVGAIPRMKTYKVCGTFDIGMHEYNSGVVFMNLNDAQLLFQMSNNVSGIEIILESLDDVIPIKNSIIKLLRENTFDNKNLIIVDWREANKTLVDVLQIERTVMFLILSLIILIAAFNIVSSLMLLVHDKMKEIAILRTIGMTKGAIMRIFMISGSFVGVIGTILGTSLGILFSTNIEKIRGVLEGISGVTLFDPIIYFLTTLPSDVQPAQVLLIASIALGISFIATIYPAWRVSKTSPAEVLKY